MQTDHSRAEDRLILHLCAGHGDAAFAASILRRKSFDRRYFLQTIRRHHIGPRVLDALLRLPLPSAAERGLRTAAKAEILAAAHDNAVFRSELARILRLFAEEKIECLLLKGLSLDFDGLRSMGDIDLLVRKGDLVRAIDALLRNGRYGYRPARFDGLPAEKLVRDRLPPAEKRRVGRQLPWNNEFQLINPERGVMIELHHRLFQMRNPRGRYSEIPPAILQETSLFWEARRWNPDLGCYTLAPEHSLLLMCLNNATKHAPANSTFRLSVVVDIDRLVKRGISWPVLVRDAMRVGAAPFVLFSLHLAKDLLGTPVPAPVRARLKAGCTAAQLRAVRIHRRCVRSLSSSSILYSKWYQAISPAAFGGSPWARWGRTLLMPIWFPVRERMALFFNLPKNSPWIVLAYALNPFRWVYRTITALLTGRG